MRHLIDAVDLSVEELAHLCDLAIDIKEHPDKYAQACRGKKLATLFFEPSTRTRMSFEAAMLDLGGSVISMPGGGVSSAVKGESIQDTATVISSYVDIIAMRHPVEGAARLAARHSTVPFINAGDGGHCHPTQTLADILTIRQETGRLCDITVGLCGDLLYGRTVHSLIRVLSRYEKVRFVLISPRELQLPDYMAEGLTAKVCTSLEEALPELDILYMTRVQKERFEDEEQYERLKDAYILTPERMALGKPGLRVLHPLPRVNEIDPRVDEDPRACYFKQVRYGKLMRMALILTMLSGEGRRKEEVLVQAAGRCHNPHCVCQKERNVPPEFICHEGQVRCAWCESAVE